jgi:hypothetical protein
MIFAVAEVLANLLALLSHTEFSAMIWRQAISMAMEGPPPIYTTAGIADYQILLSFSLTAPQQRSSGPATNNPGLITLLCIS